MGWGTRWLSFGERRHLECNLWFFYPDIVYTWILCSLYSPWERCILYLPMIIPFFILDIPWPLKWMQTHKQEPWKSQMHSSYEDLDNKSKYLWDKEGCNAENPDLWGSLPPLSNQRARSHPTKTFRYCPIHVLNVLVLSAFILLSAWTLHLLTFLSTQPSSEVSM